MTETVTAKEVVKDMEHLVRLLHKEWERSGKTKAEVIISLVETPAVNLHFASAIKEKEKQLTQEELTFKQSLELSRENFILLRLVKKIKKAEDNANQKGLDATITVELDKEEYKIFERIIQVEG